MANQKFSIPIQRIEIIIHVLTFMVIFYISFLMVMKYGNTPENISTNYNHNGEPDGLGHKSSLIVIYIVGLILYLGLSILSRYPHLYNYPVKITSDNIRLQYLLGRSLINMLNLGLVIIFLFIIESGLNYSPNNQNLLMGGYFVYFALGVTFIPIVIYFVLSLKNK